MIRSVHRRKSCAATASAIFLLSIVPSFAQSWPQRSIRLIVPIAAGSAPDVAARVFAEHLAIRWGKPVVVENRPGADGLTGTTIFATTPDDHALLFHGAAPVSVYPFVSEKLGYDPSRDLLPVSVAVETFGTISAPTSLSIASLSELATFARLRPGKLDWATGGGAFPILTAGFVKLAGLDMTHVPYRDQNLALQDLAEGRIHVFTTAMTAILPLVQAGTIRVLAVSNKKRSPFWPDIPTTTEAGYPSIEFEGLLGLFASRNTPEDRRERIASVVRAIAADPAVAKRLGASGQIVRGSTPAGFATAIEEQRLRISAIVQLIGKPPQ
jgi:tripartite-type tricarboxylate transporter receptor subunit TctC